MYRDTGDTFIVVVLYYSIVFLTVRSLPFDQVLVGTEEHQHVDRGRFQVVPLLGDFAPAIRKNIIRHGAGRRYSKD